MKKKQQKQEQSTAGWLTFATNQSEKIDAFALSCSAQLLRELDSVALAAIGGYGRRELAPASDIDILAFSESPLNAAQRRKLSAITGWQWPNGQHASLLVHDAASLRELITSDIGALTSLLDRRRIAGSKSAMKALDAIVKAHIATQGVTPLIAAKLAEQDARHKAMGDSRYHLQPDVKEGKGALRDLHTLRWLSQIILGSADTKELVRAKILRSDEAKRLERAHNFFSTVRYHLHTHAGRAQDRLAFELQPVIADKMGYKIADTNNRAEAFMRDYFRMTQETAYLTRILCAALEDRALATGGATAGRKKAAIHEEFDGFAIRNNRLLATKHNDFKKHPVLLIRLFRASQQSGMDIHPDTLRQLSALLPAMTKQLRQDDSAYALFFDILCDDRNNAITLRRMNEAGVLLALIPAFTNIHVHMQYDMYHTYTADEHTIRACGILHDIATGRLKAAAPLATSLIPTLAMPRLLYLAMFLHDMAKGSGDDHARAGAQLARDMAPRFGLDSAQADMLAWLIENHLLMTMTAFKRDLQDDKTIDDFVAVVQSPERLKMLLPLTVADIMAVGPDIWNGWKAGLLRQLYHLAYARMTGLQPEQEQKELTFFEKAIAKAPLHHGSRIVLLHGSGDTSQLVVSASDRKGLFATLAGAIAASGANIVQARIFTRSSGEALDVFDLQDHMGRAYENEKFIIKTLRRALDGTLDIDGEINLRRSQQPRVKRTSRVPARVIIDNTASYLHTLVEINATDRPGLLYDITTALTAEGMNIHAAKVATFGRHAVDVFYIKDAFGLKIEHPARLASLEKALKMELES